jgi:ethanolamine utilization protein EutM
MNEDVRAVGLIEARGFVCAVEAADAMLSAASVRLLGCQVVGGGLVTIAVSGELTDVKAAVDAGTRAAGNVGELVSVRVLQNPHPDVEQLLKTS